MPATILGIPPQVSRRRRLIKCIASRRLPPSTTPERRPQSQSISPEATQPSDRPAKNRRRTHSHSYRSEPRTWIHHRWCKDLAQRNGIPGPLPSFARFGTAVVPTVSLRDLRCEPQLTKFLRLSPLPTFLPVICPLQPCQVSSMLRYRSIPSQMRRSMEPVSRSFNT
jgi:hypothetical protein